LLPVKTWILTKGLEGRLFTSLTDNSNGISTEFSVSEFERGDPIQFKLNIPVIKKSSVSKGDTIGFVISTQLERELEQLKGELESTRALLKLQKSSEKESIVEEEKRKLDFAEKELEEQSKIYNRKLKLVERDLISREEFEADEARYELAKINIKIAKERLRTVQSGARQEEINLTNAQINALENEIKVLKTKFVSNNIVSPIDGVVNRLFSSDTLLMINDTSQLVVLMPVKWSDAQKIHLGQVVQITNQDVDEIISGKIIGIENSLLTIGGSQYLLATVLFKEKATKLMPGLNVDCSIQCESKTAYSIVTDFFNPIFN
jgi:multidrug resistance efflux pump